LILKVKVKQISVFLENKLGRLATITKVLGEKGINIRALSIADTTDFGVLRLIVSDPSKALAVLQESDFTVSETDVIAVSIADEPGGLARVLGVLDKVGVNIEYMYAFVGKVHGHAEVVFRVEDIDHSIALLAESDVQLLEAKEVYAF
jgi:hypothetical protein